MSALTPICVPCRLEMRCVKNNRVVRDPEAGGFPSTYWLGDEYECPDCGARIVTGFGVPISLVVDAERASALEFEYERPKESKPSVATDWQELTTRARAALGIVCDGAKCSECEAVQGENGCVVTEIDDAIQAQAEEGGES